MLPKNCGRLLYNAVRETLETMAFADVVPCSIKVAGEEFAQDEDFLSGSDISVHSISGWGDEDGDAETADPWGTATADAVPADDWGTASDIPVSGTVSAMEASVAETTEESWGDSPDPTPETVASPTHAASDDDAWGTPNGSEAIADDADWGTIPPGPTDPWGDAGLTDSFGSDSFSAGGGRPNEESFDAMASSQKDWHWACMKVNSPDVHSVWFIVPNSLANSLMMNMYAGEDIASNPTIVRDLIAELTNVLGGRLMLLLEEMGGRFTLTVPEIGTGMPDISEAYTSQGIVCKVTIDGEHPTIVALCFNQGGVFMNR